MQQIRCAISCALLFVLMGCAVTPKAIVDQPTVAQPKPPTPMATNPGAIFQHHSYVPVFEDVRARRVGDSITIVLSENTNSSTTAGNATSKSAATSYAPTSLFGTSSSRLSKLNLATKTSNTLAEKGSGSFSNTFNGTITVTIIDVLSNGNLKVSGEKQLAFDRNTEYVRFSGIIAPQYIQDGNLVSSTLVADAKLEYRTNSHLDVSEGMSILNRFFLSVIPF